jgi:ATP-dependent protease ClpP protease subunit
MDPKLKKLFNVQSSENEVTIHIYGIIGIDETYWGEEGTNNVAFAIVSLIRELEKQYKTINIRINSPGGIIDDGLAIYNAIKHSIADTHTYNDGVVGSMAGIIFVAGKTTHAPKTSVHHAHSASTITMGNIKAHEETINMLKTYEETLAMAYAERTGKTIDEIKQMWFDGNEHYLTGEQASDLGLIDVLEDSKVNVPDNVANMSYKQLVNLYKDNKSGKKSGIKNLVQQGFKSLFNIENSDNNLQTIKNSNKMNSKNLPLIIALLAVDFIKVDDDGKAVLDRAQIEKIEAEMNRFGNVEKNLVDVTAEKQNLEKDLKTANDSIAGKDKAIADKEKEVTDLNASIAAKDQEIADLKAKLDAQPAGSSTVTIDKNKDGNQDNVDWKTIDQLSHNKEADSQL